MCIEAFDRCPNGMVACEGTILAEGCVMGTCGWLAQLNNNLLVVGPSGSGKTSGVPQVSKGDDPF